MPDGTISSCSRATFSAVQGWMALIVVKTVDLFAGHVHAVDNGRGEKKNTRLNSDGSAESRGNA